MAGTYFIDSVVDLSFIVPPKCTPGDVRASWSYFNYEVPMSLIAVYKN